MELLTLAVALASLTYALGALILGLPIPYRPLKRWGPRLMADAVAAMIIVSSLGILLWLSDKVMEIIGVTWGNFYDWMTVRFTVLLAVYGGLQYVSTLLRSSGLDILLPIVSGTVSAVSAALTGLRIIFFVALALQRLRYYFVILGSVFYSIPFRIGRSVGATMISIGLVAYIAMPALPLFVETFSPDVPGFSIPANHTIVVDVKDSVGTPIPYPLLELRDSGGEVEGVIVGDMYGRVVLGGGKDMLPPVFNYSIKVGFLGYYFDTVPGFITELSNGSTIVVPNLVYSAGVGVLIHSIIMEVVSNEPGEIRLRVVTVLASPEVLVTKVAYITDVGVHIGNVTYGCQWVRSYWLDIPLDTCQVTGLEPGDMLSIDYLPGPYPGPNIREKRIVYGDSVEEMVESLTTYAAAVLYRELVLPAMYMGVVASLTAAAARVLGGSIRLLPR